MIDIQWDNKFELGHEKIDFEHRIFLDLIKSASNLPSESVRVHRILKEVEKYAEFHFLSEENLMLDCDYPGYLEHREEHEYLLASLRDNIVKFNHGIMQLDDITDFLFQWFALHTTQVDSELTKYIHHSESDDCLNRP